MSSVVAIEAGASSLPKPAMFHALLAASPRRIGELIDFANGVPAPWVRPLANSIFESVRASMSSGNYSAEERRMLVILGALTNRLVFECAAVPKSRHAII